MRRVIHDGILDYVIFVRRYTVQFFARWLLGETIRNRHDRLFFERYLSRWPHVDLRGKAKEKEKRRHEVARGASLIYSGPELMYGSLLDVVGAFHSAASRRETRDNLGSDQRLCATL